MRVILSGMLQRDVAPAGDSPACGRVPNWALNGHFLKMRPRFLQLKKTALPNRSRLLHKDAQRQMMKAHGFATQRIRFQRIRLATRGRSHALLPRTVANFHPLPGKGFD